jgi:hypothetical protein
VRVVQQEGAERMEEGRGATERMEETAERMEL